jgi:hypothetical protein
VMIVRKGMTVVVTVMLGIAVILAAQKKKQDSCLGKVTLRTGHGKTPPVNVTVPFSFAHLLLPIRARDEGSSSSSKVSPDRARKFRPTEGPRPKLARSGATRRKGRPRPLSCRERWEGERRDMR